MHAALPRDVMNNMTMPCAVKRSPRHTCYQTVGASSHTQPLLNWALARLDANIAEVLAQVIGGEMRGMHHRKSSNNTVSLAVYKHVCYQQPPITECCIEQRC